MSICSVCLLILSGWCFIQLAVINSAFDVLAVTTTLRFSRACTGRVMTRRLVQLAALAAVFAPGSFGRIDTAQLWLRVTFTLGPGSCLRRLFQLERNKSSMQDAPQLSPERGVGATERRPKARLTRSRRRVLPGAISCVSCDNNNPIASRARICGKGS